jgi:hypothetical protein
MKYVTADTVPNTRGAAITSWTNLLEWVGRTGRCATSVAIYSIIYKQ